MSSADGLPPGGGWLARPPVSGERGGAAASATWHAAVRMQVGALELDVRLEGGERPVALVGPNGSGKTTLLRTIAGAYRPSRGTIAVGGHVLFDSWRGIDLPPEKRRVGYVPQGYGLFPHLRVVDNVRFGLAGASRRDNGARAAALAVLEQLGAGHLDQRWPETLSGGERQRVALARALVIEPRMLLLDEPLAALDAAARRAMRRRLADRLAESGVPALVVTHDVHDIVALDAEVWVIEEGEIVQRGSADVLAARPATEFVAEVFGSPLLATPGPVSLGGPSTSRG